jgi:hypothetical protein
MSLLSCASTNSSAAETPHTPSFDDLAQLSSFLDGDWQGSYFYAEGGLWKDKKGKVTMTLRASRCRQRGGAGVVFQGVGQSDHKELDICGDASLDGAFTLWVSPKGEGMDTA